MSEIIEKENVQNINGENIDITVTLPLSISSKGKILLLHGAGESTKDRMIPLARKLSALGWECLTFSLPGHGTSSGSLLGSTLTGRKHMTEEVAKACNFWPSVECIVAVSMGSHTALSLVADYPELTKKVVLMVPGIYASEAEDVPFGPTFSEVIRRPRSYSRSLIWETLPRYSGDLTIFQAENDSVIPVEVIDQLVSSAISASNISRVIITNSTHRITTWMTANEQRLSDIAIAIDKSDFSHLEKYANKLAVNDRL